MKIRNLFLAVALLATAWVAKALPTPVYYGLDGTVVGPNGTPFNGTLSVKLARSTALNICTSPVGIVVQQPAIYKIVNGSIVNGTSAQFLGNSCMSPSIPYYAQIFDASSNLVYADNWFFPFLSGSNIDVGTLTDLGIFPAMGQAGGTNSTATPIIVALPSAIVTTPIGNQTIIQPGGTSLSINNLTVTNQLAVSGSSSFSSIIDTGAASVFGYNCLQIDTSGHISNNDGSSCLAVYSQYGMILATPQILIFTGFVAAGATTSNVTLETSSGWAVIKVCSVEASDNNGNTLAWNVIPNAPPSMLVTTSSAPTSNAYFWGSCIVD